MRILHICNDFAGSKVHSSLYKEIDRLGEEQTVYTYFRDEALDGENAFGGKGTKFVYRHILKPYHRLLYHKKVKAVYADMVSSLAMTDGAYDLAHATTLFSDGALAWRAKQDYGIPYVVSVRNTDVNVFLGYAPHTWATGEKVLKEASGIVFISKALKDKFCRHPYIKAILHEIEDKIVVQPNGIDDYWLEHVKTTPAAENHNVLYVGKFDWNKNVMKLCESVLELRPVFPDIQLHLVGGGGSQWGGVKIKTDKYPETIIYHGKIYDKAILKDVYSRCNVFAMPSLHETFGLVYIEALTQNLAIIYTKGQGVDGMLDERVGESVHASSKEDIKRAITKIFNERSKYKAHGVVDFSQFRWGKIALRYLEIYRQCAEKSQVV